ncbi:Uncharacterised protein [Vibrio cholerae]|nr:Uncharacterised protein [Vibrio cholerae]
MFCEIWRITGQNLWANISNFLRNRHSLLLATREL